MLNVIYSKSIFLAQFAAQTTATVAPDQISLLDKLKNFVNHWSVPQVSLPLFFVPIFILSLLLYRKWTKPTIFWLGLAGFTLIYFGFMFLDVSYAAILQKPDNVPITIMIYSLILCLWISMRQAAINDANKEQGKPIIQEGREDKVLCWPDLVYIELIAMVLCTVGLIIWSIYLKAPLESPANPAGPPNPSKAPWYFLGLQELLVYFDPWMAGVVLPGLIVVGLMALPYIDMNPKGNGYYTFKERKFAISTFMFGFVILWVILIVFGTFLRGPNWNFFGPFQPWDPFRVDKLTNINLSEIIYNELLDRPMPQSRLIREAPGLIFTFIWLFVLPVALVWVWPLFRKLRYQMGFARYYLMAFLFVVMMLVPLKMSARWAFNLKYIIAIPEINFNL